jgi:hypothetical protein
MDFEKAVARLDEALALLKDPIVRDSAIQRFEEPAAEALANLYFHIEDA